MPEWILVYGFTKGFPNLPAEGLEAAPYLLGETELKALVERVPQEGYDPEALGASLGDPAWAADKTRRYLAVLQGAAEEGVVPARFPTVFTAEEGVHRYLREEADSLWHSLAVVQGRGEWDVYIRLEVARRAGELTPPGPGSGREYLAYLACRKEAAQRAEQEGMDLLGRLETRFSGWEARPAQLTGEQGVICYRRSFLVPRGREELLARLVEDIRSECPWAQAELRGPWPPFSFVGGQENDA